MPAPGRSDPRPSTPAPASPARRPRRPAPNRASGTSAPTARGGTAPRPGRTPHSRPVPPIVLPSEEILVRRDDSAMRRRYVPAPLPKLIAGHAHGGPTMGKVIVVQFTTADGVV